MATTFINRGHFYAPHVKPVLIDCNFVVDSTNGNGLGIRSLKGQGVLNAFMHTTATPGLGPNGQLNPNPATTYIAIQLADNYQRYFGGFAGFEGPLTSTGTTSTTTGNFYVITSLGTTTTAQWVAAGLPVGVIPAVGAGFVALATGAIGGTGTVGLDSASGIDHIEAVGDPNTTLGPVPVGGSPNFGGWLFFRCYLAATATAPTNNSVISLAFYLSQSSVMVDRE